MERANFTRSRARHEGKRLVITADGTRRGCAQQDTRSN